MAKYKITVLKDGKELLTSDADSLIVFARQKSDEGITSLAAMSGPTDEHVKMLLAMDTVKDRIMDQNAMIAAGYALRKQFFRGEEVLDMSELLRRGGAK